MKVYHNVGYAPNPGKERRNQIPYTKASEGTSKGKSNIPESPLGRGKHIYYIHKNETLRNIVQIKCIFWFSAVSL